MATFDQGLPTPGTYASIPAFGTPGRLYFATDQNTIYRDTGSAWVSYAAMVAYRGTWVSATQYNLNDIVLASGIMYLCILATNGTTAPLADTTHWLGFAASSATNGIPTGGSTGQVLTKNSGTNYDAGWATPSGGGGGVTPYIMIKRWDANLSAGSFTQNSWQNFGAVTILTNGTYNANGIAESQDDQNGSGVNLWDGTNNRYTCPVTGTYLVQIYIQFQVGGTISTAAEIGVAVTNTTSAPGSWPIYSRYVGPVVNGTYTVEHSRLEKRTAGDFFYGYVYQNLSSASGMGFFGSFSVMRVK